MKHSLLTTAAAVPHIPADPLLPPKQAAAAAGCSIAALWRGVASDRFPLPVYPAPRAPRWYLSEIRAALEKTRALPSEAMAARRAARIARDRSAA